MKKYKLFSAISLVAALLLSACSQDELAEQGTTLPEGEYPLQISGVSIAAEASEQPWTRISESTDGQSSVWQTGDEFYVKFEGSDEVGTYRITDAAAGTVEAVTPIYWKNTQPANIIAWYAKPKPDDTNNGRIFLNNQEDNGLVYVLRAEQTATYGGTPVTLKFKHQLAKVRVIIKGTVDVIEVELVNLNYNLPYYCDVKEGEIVNIGSLDDCHMHRTDYKGIGTCWEANLPPSSDYQIEGFRVTTSDYRYTYFCEIEPYITLEAGKVHTVTITVNFEGTQIIDLSTLTAPYEIDDSGTYYATGTGQYGIRVTNGNPNIYLEDAQISVSGGNAINITSGNPTIHVKGNDNEVSSGNGAGIYVAENSSVTITGRSREDVLTARGGNGGNGIGGYTTISGHTATSTNSGNISVSNVTVYAYGSDYNADVHAPGIGGAGSASCGTITIDNATVYAYGTGESYYNVTGAAIGGGINADTKGSYSTITIENGSEVYVQRGNFRSDYIGHSGSTNNPATATDGIDAMVDETSTVTKLN
ncbi:fimbrillin family protein [Phocaeicola barnesiae]